MRGDQKEVISCNLKITPEALREGTITIQGTLSYLDRKNNPGGEDFELRLPLNDPAQVNELNNRNPFAAYVEGIM